MRSTGGTKGASMVGRGVSLRFVVVGAFVADCIVNTARLPSWGDDLEARAIRISPGGKAFNQAVALARLGAHVTAVGVIGGDALGRDVLATLSQEGVDASELQICEHMTTPVCVCLVGDDGATSFLYYLAEDAALTSDVIHAADAAIHRADAVLMTFEAPLPALQATIESANRHGSRLLVQPAPPLREPADLATLSWDAIDLLVPNEAEARALVHDEDHEARAPADLAAALARTLAVPTVVVTLGAAGCVAYSSGTSRHYAAHRVAEVIDSTGASDAFAAALALELTAGGTVPDAIQAALSAAASAVKHPGGHESMPYGAELDPRSDIDLAKDRHANGPCAAGDLTPEPASKSLGGEG